MSIGNEIYNLRKQKKLSQEELADKLDVSRQSVSLWETDQTVPSIDNLIRMSEIFGVSMDRLCGKERAHMPQTTENKRDGAIGHATTAMNDNIAKQTVKLSFTNKAVINFVLLIFSLIYFFATVWNENFNGISWLSLIASFTILISLIKLRFDAKTAFKNYTARGEYTVDFWFFTDYFEIESKSATSHSSYVQKYADVALSIDKNDLLFIVFNGIIAVIDKKNIDKNSNLILSLFENSSKRHQSSNGTTYNEPLKMSANKAKVFKVILMILFILSLCSLWIALILVAIATGANSPSDGVTAATAVKNMWVFFLVLPIPLTSLILGLYCKRKGVKKCTKNIVVGIIFSSLLTLYGSFTFIFADFNTNDYTYSPATEQIATVEKMNL